MFKRILFGALLFAVISILAAGAAARTMDRAGLTEARGQGHGRVASAAVPYDGNGQGRGTGNPLNLTESQAVEWVTLQGTVISADENVLTVQTINGEKVTVENRPWWFALEQKFTAQVGDRVKLTGFYESGDFEVGRIENLTSGKAVQLRDQDGRPGWAGRGGRGG